MSTTPENTKDDFELLLDSVIEDKGGSKEDYRHLLDSIAFHESAGTMDPTIHQFGGGPGRGKYQFEGKGGSNRVLTSAVRAKNYYRSKGLKVPTFIQNIINKGTEDASILSASQQDILALGDLRMKKGIDLANYVEGKISVEDIWLDHWWAGPSGDRDKKAKAFRSSMSKFSPKERKVSSMDIPREQLDNIKVIDATSVAQPRIKETEVEKKNSLKIPVYKTENTNYIQDYINNIKAFGGTIGSKVEDKQLNEFNAGGLHEQNPYGGIPQGMGKNGKMNTVEEGESSYTFPDLGKYIFSNRITLQ